MAIYHMHVTVGTRSGGQSAAAKIDYIWRQGPYRRDHAEQVQHMASGNMPAWAEANPAAYWRAADTHERMNGTLFREVEFALPIELAEASRVVLAERFARELSGDHNLPWSLAIHAGRDATNPHCHLVLSERRHDGHDRTAETWFRRAAAPARRGLERPDPASGGALKVSLRGKAWLAETRARWARAANKALEAAGDAARIDHRSYAAQGLDLVPGQHVGPHVAAMHLRGIRTERGRIALATAVAAAEVRDLVALREELQNESANSVRARPDPEGPMSRPDLTRAAVERQLAAMGQDRYELGIRDRDSGQMMERSWSAGQVLDGLAWLKRQNARGSDIYIRPAAPEHDLVLLDDVDEDGLDAMRSAGHDPALVLETSPSNYQAWLRLPEPQPPEVRREVARALAHAHGGDRASADARHFGRLSGFTNRKPAYTTGSGLQPWVLLRQAGGRVAAAAASLVEAACERLAERARDRDEPADPQGALDDGDDFTSGGPS